MSDTDTDDLIRESAEKQIAYIKECRAELRALSLVLRGIDRGDIPQGFDWRYGSLMAFRGHGLLGELQDDYERIIESLDEADKIDGGNV